MATAAMRRENDEVRRLVDDRPRETSTDITVPEDEAADGDALISHVAADSVEILMRDPLVTANQALTQIERFSLQRSNLGQLRYRNYVNQDDFSLVCLCQADSKGNGAFCPGRSIEGHKDPSVVNDIRIRNGIRHEQE